MSFWSLLLKLNRQMFHPWAAGGYSLKVLLLLSLFPLVLQFLNKLLRPPIPLLLDSSRKTGRIKRAVILERDLKGYLKGFDRKYQQCQEESTLSE